MKVSNMIKKGVKVKKITLILIVMAYGLVGCGGTGTNNDQGTSVLAFGYFEVGSISDPISFAFGSLNNGESLNVGIGIQNRLVGAGNIVGVPSADGANAGITGTGEGIGQFLNITQINCFYDVPGSSIATVRDSTTVGSVIAPGSSASIGFPILSAGIKSFFAVRANQLPNTPFNLIANCQAVAISQAGDVFESNSLPLQILIRDDIITTEAPATLDNQAATLDGSIITEETTTDTGTDTESTDTSDTTTSAL